MLKIFYKNFLFISTCFVFFLLMAGCRNQRKKVDVSQVNVNIVADHLENDLVDHADDLSFLKNKYESFFDLYIFQIIHLTVADSTDTMSIKKQLNNFIHDVDIANIYTDTKQAYSSFGDINLQFTDAFRHYKYYFPEKLIPKVITFISGFNYAVVAADSMLGVGLDMYLGSDSKFYRSLPELPQYKIRKMERHYLVADAVRGWAQTEWERSPLQTDLLSQMIYEGKMVFLLDMLMPDSPDSVKTGYSQKQIEWCRANEKSTWSFFVDRQLLYASDPGEITKYVTEGPTTGGFPKESPGNIGQWIGAQIVKNYMDRYPNVSLSQLMAEQDYKKIFNESKYKPRK